MICTVPGFVESKERRWNMIGAAERDLDERTNKHKALLLPFVRLERQVIYHNDTVRLRESAKAEKSDVCTTGQTVEPHDC